MIWLFIYALALSLHDLRTRRIPNWCTLPLILAGVIAHFPSQPEIWLANFVLMFAWAGGWMGAGDVKLWIALLWALPVEQTSNAVLFMFMAFLTTSVVQVLYRALRKQPVSNWKTPAAWRTLFFLLILLYVH